MEVLAAYEKLIPKEQFNKKNYLSKDRKNSITRSYLKGITMKDLALQNNCSENLIEQILTNRGIEIVKEGLKFKNPVWIRRKTKSKKGLFLYLDFCSLSRQKIAVRWHVHERHIHLFF